MSEDRTQPASKHRRQLAREQGQVVHSPELTAAAGWMVAVLVLGFWGQDLVGALVELARAPLEASAAITTDPADTVWRIRSSVFSIAAPVGIVLFGFLIGATAAHQTQVQGLWAPSLIAPDVGRLWRFGRGGGLAAKFERSVWSVVKALILTAVAYWGIQSQWNAVQRLSAMDLPSGSRAALDVVLSPARILAGVMLVVGLVDYALRSARFEAMLRTTPQEQREDQRMIEGDPGLRTSRRRLVQAWRDGTPELLAGSTLVLLGEAGLTVVLSGGPPPRKVSIRVLGQGKTGISIRKAAGQAKIPRQEASQLALRIASLPNTGPSRATITDPLLLAQLRSVWPTA